MAQLNIRIDDELKESVDEKLKALNISATDSIIGLYQYIDQNEKLPFIIQTKIDTPDSVLEQFIKGLNNAAFSINHIADIFDCDMVVESEIQHHKDVLWAYRTLLLNNLSYIHSLPETEQKDWKTLTELFYDAVIMTEMPLRLNGSYSAIEPYVKDYTRAYAKAFQEYVEKLNKLYPVNKKNYVFEDEYFKLIEANYPGSTQKLLRMREANLFRIGSGGDTEPSE